MSGQNQSETLRSAQAVWEKENAERFTRERKQNFESLSGIPFKRVYTPLDLEERGFEYTKDLGLPGSFPYTRGITPTMYREELVTMRDAASHGTPEETNKLYKALFAGGADPFIMHFYDLPSQRGYDPDDPRAAGEVGTVGTSLVSLRDWEVLLDGIDMSQVMICQVMSSLSAVALASHALIQEQRGLPLSQMYGLVQNDILKEYIACSYYVFPIEHGMRQAVDIIVWATENAPHYVPVHVQSYQQREKGATPVQEAAIGIASAATYMQAVVDRGVDVDAFAPNLNVVTTCSHATFFEDIAKWRAMRRIWAKIMRDRFKAKKPESLHLRIQNGPGGLLAYRQEYLNNIPRATLAALSAIFGGVQWCRFVPPSEAFGVPTVEGLYFALQGMRVLGYETDINDVVDPLAGSYFVETLTSEVEERVRKELDAIEKNGGVIRCIETGYFQRQYAENSYKWQKAFDAGEIVRVGVNRFLDNPGQQEKPIFRPYRANPDEEAQRIAAVKELRRTRDNDKVRKALARVKEIAAAPPGRETNIVPPIIEACRCYATIGEIADALREVWGEYQGPGTRSFK